MSGRASIKLATAQTLTSSYVASNVLSSFSLTEESLATLEITYTTGASETAAYLEFIVEYSYNDSSWVQESYSDLVSGVNTLAPMVHKVPGGAGATAYTAQYFVPLCSRYARIRVKETGVSSNYGTVNVILTVAAGMGQQRNLQETSLTTGALTIGTVNQGTAGISAWPVSVSGGSTAAKQDTGNTSLSSIDGKMTACNTGAVVLAASTASIGLAISSPQVGTAFVGTATQSVLTAFANVAASQTDSSIVAANGSKVIYVLGFQIVTGGTATGITFNSKGGGAGAAISPLYANGANGGISCPPSGIPYFRTTAGEALTVTTGAGATTGVIIQYIQI